MKQSVWRSIGSISQPAFGLIDLCFTEHPDPILLEQRSRDADARRTRPRKHAVVHERAATRRTAFFQNGDAHTVATRGLECERRACEETIGEVCASRRPDKRGAGNDAAARART